MKHKHYETICEWAQNPDKVVQCRSNSNELWEDIRIGVPLGVTICFTVLNPKR